MMLLVSSTLLVLFSIASALEPGYGPYPAFPEATDGQFPFAARVRALYNNGTVYRECIGGVLGRDWVVTEARCSGERFELTFGVANFDKSSPHRVQMASQLWVPHPLYNNSNVRFNNIGLLKLERRLNFNRYIKPVTLPEPGCTNFVDDKVTFIPAYFNLLNQYRLMYNEMTVMSDAACELSHYRDTSETCIKETASPTVSVCKSDNYPPSGSMSVIEKYSRHNKVKEFILVVLGSWTLCENTPIAVAGALLTDHLDWINDVTGIDCARWPRRDRWD